MPRSHLERGPAEFVELKIWANSESLPGLWRALSHIQIGRLPDIFRTQIRASCGGLRSVVDLMLYKSAGFWAVLESDERHKLGRTCTKWGGPLLNACSMGNFIFFERASGEAPEKCKIAGKARSSLTHLKVRQCDEKWAIPRFWQRSHRSPHDFTDSSPDLPVFLVARATFTYSF